MTSAWFETVSSEIVYEGWSTVRRDRVRTPEGSEVEREVVVHDDAVAMVPVMDDGTVLLLRQYRHPFQADLLEIPAGKLDVDGESAMEAAQRELVEEVGHRAGRLDPLVTIANSVGWTNERTHLFLARDLVPAPPPDGFEPHAEELAMEVVRVPLVAAIELITAGDLPDAKTIIGLLLARERLAGGAG